MYSAIDIGTNSCRLYIGKWEDNRLVEQQRELIITRLGEGVDKNLNLSEQGIMRTVSALKKYRESLSAKGLAPLQVMATSAVRDAKNQQEFLDRVKECTGFDVCILSGDEEAKLSFLGAISTLKLPESISEGCVIDIGGGSTELICGNVAGEIGTSGSVQAGAVRMTEKYVTQHPIDQTELGALEEGVYSVLAPLFTQISGKQALVIGVGGTATTLAAIHLGLSEYDSSVITGTPLSLDQTDRLYHKLAEMTLDERLAVTGLQPGREDVIVAGAAIMLTGMKILGADKVVVCDGDLLQGSIIRMLTANR